MMHGLRIGIGKEGTILGSANDNLVPKIWFDIDRNDPGNTMSTQIAPIENAEVDATRFTTTCTT